MTPLWIRRFTAYILAFTFAQGALQAEAQEAMIRIECESGSFGGTECNSFSPNATTKSNVVADVGNVAKVRLRNIENVPVLIRNNTNTDTMYLYVDVVNRGRPQDLTIDLKPSYTKESAPVWMRKSPNAGSGLVLADSIKSLNVDISGYVGRPGKNLSEMCGDRAKKVGYFPNPLNLQSIRDANDRIAGTVPGTEPKCSAATLQEISKLEPGSFCPTGHFYLVDRDGQSQPSLIKREGEVRGPLESLDSNEAPVRLQYMKKCVKNVIYRTCRFYNSTYSKTVSDVTSTCEDKYYELLGNEEVPEDLNVIETNTVIRDVTNYYEEGEATEAAQIGKCPGHPYEVLEMYTQLHGQDSYEQLECRFADCPRMTDTYTYGAQSPLSFEVERGEDGSFGGRFDIFAYDIAESAFTFANGSNGPNGSVDLSIPTTKKYCAKVDDARNLNGSIESARVPIVNFHTAEYSPIGFTLPVTVPGTSFKRRTQTEAVGIFKKVDSSVRDFILKEFIDPRFL